MKAVLSLEMRQHVAICGQRSLPLALLEPQTAVPQEPGELLAFCRPGAGRDQRWVRLRRDVKMVPVKPPNRYASPGGEGVQLVIGRVTDHVRPQTAVRRPAGWVDPDRHRLLLISGCRP